jgi:peroxiredoxin
MKATLIIGSYVPDFEIPGVDGAVHHLSRYLEQFRAVGVVIMCNHCPYVKLYLESLKQLQTQIAAQGATLVGINPNDETRTPEDNFAAMQSFATAHQLNFPYLRDVTQEVARGFGAARTPEVFLIDQVGRLRYSGGIDDQPQNPANAQQHYLRDAVLQLLAREEIVYPVTEAVGCSIKWREG